MADISQWDFFIFFGKNPHQSGIVHACGICQHNNFKAIMSFIQSLNELVITSKGSLLITIDPSTMEKKDYSILQKEISQVL